ncbi:hypothetical protein Tco_0110104 [Tanacetum coccineum]
MINRVNGTATSGGERIGGLLRRVTSGGERNVAKAFATAVVFGGATLTIGLGVSQLELHTYEFAVEEKLLRDMQSLCDMSHGYTELVD